MNSIINGVVSATLSSFLPVLVELLALVLMAWLVRVSAYAKKKWGIEIEARHREALHSAFLSGIRAALIKGLAGDDAVKAAIDHVNASVPDAIAALSPTTQVLLNIGEAKLREVVAQSPFYVGFDKGAAS